MKKLKPPKPARSVAAPTAPVAEARMPIKFRVNIIASGQFISAGQPSLYFSLDEVPMNLKAFAISDEPDEPADDDSPRSATFVLGTL